MALNPFMGGGWPAYTSVDGQGCSPLWHGGREAPRAGGMWDHTGILFLKFSLHLGKGPLTGHSSLVVTCPYSRSADTWF